MSTHGFVSAFDLARAGLLFSSALPAFPHISRRDKEGGDIRGGECRGVGGRERDNADKRNSSPSLACNLAKIEKGSGGGGVTRRSAVITSTLVI